jgi:hypothetical protein
MSETDFARSWWLSVLGGELERPEPPYEKEGREPVTELSARDLNCSDQLKPWSGREEYMSEETLGFGTLLACRFRGTVMLLERRLAVAAEFAAATAAVVPIEV